MTARLSPFDAADILARTHSAGRDYHALDSDAVESLLAEANRLGYRKPRNANGSRGRYFHAYLCRVAARKE